MSTLTLNLNGKNIEVISVEDLGDRKRIFLGDVDSDIILRSLNGIKIQIGNKIIDTGFSYDQTNNSISSSSTIKQYSNIEDNFTSIEGSLVDGDLLYDIITERLYIYSGYSLIKLTDVSESKQYLSFLDTQILTGDEKILLLKNAGISVSSLKTLTSIYPSDSFPNMMVYVAEEKQHYCLIGENSRSISSWTPVYLSSIKGGTSNGSIVIDPLNVNNIKSALHINGYYDSNVLGEISETQRLFSIGDTNLSKGLAAWCHSDGNVYIQGLDKTINTGITFTTTTGEITNNLLTLKGQKVGINADVTDKYDTTIGGKTLFNNKVYLKDKVSSELFSSGFAGYGMKLGRDQYGYWSLDIDNLTVRQRMSIYELVVNQIKATNGSLWVSDGAKIKTATKIVDMPIYIKARYAGNYKAGLNNTYIEIPIEERPPYALVNDPTNTNTNLEGFKMGFGYGDSYLRIVNNVATYVNPSYNTFIEQNGSYVAIPPTHRLDPVLGFVSDTNGEYILADTVSIYGITFEDIPPFFEGDLVRMQNWDSKLNKLRFARCQIGLQRSTSGADSTPEVLVYTFQGDDLVNGLSLVRIGNNKDNIMSEFSVPGGTIIREKKRGLLIPDAVFIRDIAIEQAEPNRLGAIYLTAADSGAPYIDIIDKVESHNAFNPARNETNPDSSIVEVMQTRLKVRLGKLAGLIDLDMGLDGGTWQNYLYGIYTDSGFFKGNLVAQAGKIGDLFLKGGSLFTYNDGNLHTPMDFEYENSANQLTANGKINTNWLFGKDLAGVLLDGKTSRFSLGSKLKYENGNLTIDGQINANTGLIGGWEINDKGIKKDVTSSGIGVLSSYLAEGPTIYSGCTYANFLLDKENALFYVDATGNLKSKSGNIGGWTIINDALYKNKLLVGTGLLSSSTTDVSFYSGCTYDNIKLNKENALFYVLDDGSMKSTKGFIGGINIANDKLYTSHINGIDNLRLNNDGLNFFDNTENVRVSINNSSVSLYDMKSLFNKVLTLPVSVASSNTYTSNSFIINTIAQHGSYKFRLDPKFVNFILTYQVQGDPDPSLLNININTSCRMQTILQKKNPLNQWVDIAFSSTVSNNGYIETSSLAIVQQFASSLIDDPFNITENGEYRAGVSIDFDIHSNITWRDTGLDANATIASDTSFVFLGDSGQNIITSHRDITLNVVNTTGFVSYSLGGSYEQYFAVKSNAGDGGFLLNTKGGVQLVQPEGSLGKLTWNIPGVLVAGEVSSDTRLLNYWSHSQPKVIRVSTGLYKVYFYTSNLHDDWFPSAVPVFNATNGMILCHVEKVPGERLDDAGLVCSTMRVHCFNSSNGAYIDNGFVFTIFGRNTYIEYA